MLFHVFRHIEADDRILRAKHRLRKCPRQFRLADARRPEEEERADRAARILDPCTRAANSTRHGMHCFVLPDDAAANLRLKCQQAVGFLDRDALHGNARPLCHHGRNIVLRHADLHACILALAGCIELRTQILLAVAQVRCRLIVLLADSGILLLDHPCDLTAQADQTIRPPRTLHAHMGGRLIHQIYRLVRQEAIRQVPLRKSHGSRNRSILDARMMELLIAAAQTEENLLRIRSIRFINRHRLKPPRERAVFRKVLLILAERRRADNLHLTARKSGLQNVCRIECALGTARTDERVNLIDEEDDVLRLDDIIHHILQALLKLTAVLRARDECRHRQRHNVLVLQQEGHLSGGNAPCQSLGDGRLADPRLTKQEWIVLRPPCQNLNHAINLRRTANHGVKTSCPGRCGQIRAKLFQ